MANYSFCICNKMCTSRAGLTLHQRGCDEAKAAVKDGKVAVKESDIILPRADYAPEVKEFIDLAEEVAHDAHLALVNSNKSAGRRSRTGMIKLRNTMVGLRKQILSSMKGKKGAV